MNATASGFPQQPNPRSIRNVTLAEELPSGNEESAMLSLWPRVIPLPQIRDRGASRSLPKLTVPVAVAILAAVSGGILPPVPPGPALPQAKRPSATGNLGMYLGQHWNRNVPGGSCCLFQVEDTLASPLVVGWIAPAT